MSEAPLRRRSIPQTTPSSKKKLERSGLGKGKPNEGDKAPGGPRGDLRAEALGARGLRGIATLRILKEGRAPRDRYFTNF